MLLHVIPLAQPYATGLLLLALAPCAPFAPALLQRARGDPAYTAAFMMLAAVATVAVMPLAVPQVIRGMSVEPALVAGPLVSFVLLPLLLGMAVRALAGGRVGAIRRLVAALTNGAGLAVLVLIAVIHGSGVLAAIGSHAIAIQILFVAVVTSATHLAASGLPPEQRSVLTIGMCTRNLGAALAPLGALESDPRAVVMIAIAAPVTLAMSGMTARWLARSSASTRSLRSATVEVR
jgi:BASS family bile acid:Na+ symporter